MPGTVKFLIFEADNPIATYIRPMKNIPDFELPRIGNWSELKSKIKAKFPALNYSDLQYEESRNEEMLNKIQIKLGITKEELQKIITTL